ncbi:hypothetical protein EVAR_3819_1 [Eumeta japonica]|uniref:Uncharacterized protein n=1 Tax=Eumeta variegata TaxID=151549 RepID=A0A4C1SSQ8_EUMVA|nr:hypothetical protein EVAR_3819_1 [Eumeta japonica]
MWCGSLHFFHAEGLHILNESNTPTFETYRGDRFFRSVVDVTACSSTLLDSADRVVYNAAKVRWSEFGTTMDIALTEWVLTVELVVARAYIKSVGSCD